MALISLDALLVPQSATDIEDAILSICTSAGLSVTSWDSGGIARTIIASVSTKLADLSSVIPALTRGGFRELAAGGWLDLVNESVFNTPRILAKQATGPVRFTNSTGVAHTVAAADIIVAHIATGKTYTLVDAGTIPAYSGSGPLPYIDLNVLADEAGTASTAAGGQITVMVTTITGVTCSNPVAINGQDGELDDPYRARGGDKLGTLSPNGPQAAYDFIARSTAVVVTRTKVDDDKTNGNVIVRLANASGSITGDDLATVQQAIYTACVPLAITPDVAGATPNVIADIGSPLQLIVYVYASANEDLNPADGHAFADTVRAAISTYIGTVPIGGDYNAAVPSSGFVFLSRIQEAARSVNTAKIPLVQITSATSDFTLGLYDVATIGDDTQATLQLTIIQVPDP